MIQAKFTLKMNLYSFRIWKKNEILYLDQNLDPTYNRLGKRLVCGGFQHEVAKQEK